MMKALITNAVMTLLDDQIVNAAEKGVVDELYGLIPLGYLFLWDGVISALGPMSALQGDMATNTAMNHLDVTIDAKWQVIDACLN
jgi:hypothetical protein